MSVRKYLYYFSPESSDDYVYLLDTEVSGCNKLLAVLTVGALQEDPDRKARMLEIGQSLRGKVCSPCNSLQAVSNNGLLQNSEASLSTLIGDNVKLFNACYNVRFY